MKHLMRVAGRFGVVLIFIGLLGMVARSAWTNHQTQQKIDELQTAISTQQAQNDFQQQLLVYYQTQSYKELEARRKLGLKKPDEQAVIVPTSDPNEGKASDTTNLTGPLTQEVSIPIWRQWVHLVLRI